MVAGPEEFQPGRVNRCWHGALRGASPPMDETMTLRPTLLACAFLLAVSSAAAGEERLLGSTRLSRVENDEDVLRVACRPKVSAVKLHAARGQVEIERLWVRYGNGTRDTLAVRDRLAQGTDTRWIDLAGGKRCVVAVGIVGDTEWSFDQARVDVWGR